MKISMQNRIIEVGKNPYASGTPEWQLFENAESNAGLARAYANDADRFTKLSQQAREKSELFRVALEKLTCASAQITTTNFSASENL